MFYPGLNERQSKVDWLLLLAIAGLMAIGVAFIYSATMVNEAARVIPWYNQLFFRQIVWCVVGLGASFAICLLDYHSLARWSYVFYWVAILFLVLVFVAGSTVFGARRWIDLGPFKLQPSEFAKLAFILAMAHFLSRPVDELRQPIVFWKALGLIGLPFVLILKEPDLGSALIFLPMGLVMLYVAGVPVRYLAQLLGGGGIVIILIMVDVLVVWLLWIRTLPLPRGGGEAGQASAA